MLERADGQLVIAGAFSSGMKAIEYLVAYNKVTRFDCRAKSIRKLPIDPKPVSSIRTL